MVTLQGIYFVLGKKVFLNLFLLNRIFRMYCETENSAGL